MKTSILTWFAPPEVPGDEENKHRVRLMNGLINAEILFPLLIICANLLDRSTPLRNYLIDLLVLAVFLTTRFALRKGHTLFAGIGSLTFGFILTIASMISDGTVRSSATSLLLLVIIISGILYKIYGIMISTIASSLAVLMLLLAEKAGMLPRPDYSPSFVYWFILTFTFAIIGGITYYSNRVTMQAFKHANEELRERQRAEHGLKAANEELHKRVIVIENLQEELREQAGMAAKNSCWSCQERRFLLPKSAQKSSARSART